MQVRMGSKGREEKLKGTRCNFWFCFVLREQQKGRRNGYGVGSGMSKEESLA